MTNEDLLIKAVDESDIDEVDRLISIGVNVNAKCKAGMPAIDYVKHNKVGMEIAKKLFIAGVPVRKGWLLHSATIFCNAELMELLIKSGDDVNARDMSARDPFLALCRFGNVSKSEYRLAIDLLIRSGADMRKNDCRGKGAMYNAFINDNFDLIEVLLDYDIDHTISYRPLLFSMLEKQDKYFRRIVNMGGDINEKSTASGENVLFRVISNDKINLTKFLIKKGIDINCQEFIHGETPAIFAAQIKVKHHVLALLKAGADFSIEDNKGKTALDYLAYDDDFRSLVEKKLLERDFDNENRESPGL